MFDPINAAIKFRNIAAKWAKATGVDPGDKGQIENKAKSYINNLGLSYEEAWLTALVNWMLEMPWEDSRQLMANGVIEFLNSYDDKIPLSNEITNSAREAAIDILGNKQATPSNGETNEYYDTNGSDDDRQIGYASKVEELIKAYGINIKLLRSSNFETKRLINYAFEKGYSEHEAASGITHAFMQLLKMFDTDTGHTALTMWSAKAQQWVEEGLILKNRTVDVAKDLTKLTSTIYGIPYAQGSDYPKATTGEYCFSLTMPDVRCFGEGLAYEAGEYVIYFGKNIPTLEGRFMGKNMPVEYIYAMIVLDKNNGLPQYYVTLEKGVTGSNFLCTFDREGIHNNFGNDAKLEDENSFIVKALEMIKDEFGFDRINVKIP